MRRTDYTQLSDGFFSLNSDFYTHDEIGDRGTYSGLMKRIFPDEHIEQGYARMILLCATKGRRRVKEHHKFMAGVEAKDMNLGYVVAENPAYARIVFVAEQGEETKIPEASLLPGDEFAIARSIDDLCAGYKLESKALAGSYHFEHEGAGANWAAHECIEAAWSGIEIHDDRDAAGMQKRKKDYLLVVHDVQAYGPNDEISLVECTRCR